MNSAETRRPNILLAIADDWAWPHASAYGCTFVNTPTFDRLANEGVKFTNAFTAAPSCAASRAALLTGLYPWSMEAAATLWGYIPARFETYPDVLEKAGYFVGVTQKGWGPGSIDAPGRTRNPAGPGFDKHRLEPLTSCMAKNDYVANFEDFLSQKPEEKPFCFWFGAKEPHRIYEEGSGVRNGKKLEDVQVPPYLPDCETVRSDLCDYALEAERYDADLGRMLDILEARGELDNTIVIMTGDNGMPFPRAKSHIYENGCHIPFVVRYGKAVGGRTVTDYVNFIDVAPTLFELTGVTGPSNMAGRSFVDVLQSSEEGRVDSTRDYTITGVERHGYGRPGNLGYPMRSIVTDDYIYVRNYECDRWPCGDPEYWGGNCDGSPSKTWILEHRESHPQFFNWTFGKRPEHELYMRTFDAACLENCIDEEGGKAKAEELRERMEGILNVVGDPRVDGRGWEFECVPFIRKNTQQHPEWPHMDLEEWQTCHIPEGETSRFDRTRFDR